MKKIIFRSLFTLYMLTQVKHLSAQAWHTVGNPGFTTRADWTSIAVDKDGTPYIAYCDYANGEKATVMKYVNNAWIKVGSGAASFNKAAFTYIIVDGNRVPYVVYEGISNTSNYHIVLKKFNGSTWEQLGATLPSDSYAAIPSLAIDKQIH